MTVFGTGASITPTLSTSKILVTITCSLSASTAIQVPVSIFRDATNLTAASDNGMVEMIMTSSADTKEVTVRKLDAPSTTSAITYKLGVYVSSDTVYSGRRGDSTAWNKGSINITLMEILA